jgi:hypothetical protein
LNITIYCDRYILGFTALPVFVFGLRMRGVSQASLSAAFGFTLGFTKKIVIFIPRW